MKKEHMPRHVRDALEHFHDPAFLQTSPLASLLAAGSDGAVPARLQESLREGVECLRPDASIPAERPEWLAYRILQYRYLQLRNVHAVCSELTLSPASLYRHQQQAIEALADMLWRGCRHDDGSAAPPGNSTVTTADEWAVHEAIRLAHTTRREPVDLDSLMKSVRHTFATLATQRGVRFVLEMDSPLPTIHGDAAIFHQIVVNLLTGALNAGRGQALKLQIDAVEQEIVWHLSGVTWDAASEKNLWVRPEFCLTRGLLGVYGGRLWLESQETEKPGLFFALPRTKPETILVIEDHEDTLQLYRRYLQQHGYSVRVARNGEEAWQLLMEETPPSLIILDVLMPKEDGWMILQRLKVLPETASIPVIIYSVLGQPSLAMALGAARVLRKPVEEDILLRAIQETLRPPDSRV